jgi:hypothetical protein
MGACIGVFGNWLWVCAFGVFLSVIEMCIIGMEMITIGAGCGVLVTFLFCL